MKILCIIPARAGSRGVPGKNIKPLNGKPLICYTTQSALQSRLINKIIISTDSYHIADAARHSAVDIPFIRPACLAADTTPTADVLKHAIDFFDKKNERYDTICLLQPTSPFRSAGFIDICIEAFIQSKADCLFSAKKIPHEYNPHWAFVQSGDGFLKIATGDGNIIPNRQALPPAYIRDGSVYIFKADNIRYQHSIYGEKVTYAETPAPGNINIDTMDDWQRAEQFAGIYT